MDEQDGSEFKNDSDPVRGRHESVNVDSNYRSEYRRSNYSDAHFEPAGESTVPPRYYTPQGRPSKAVRVKQNKNAGGHVTGILCAILAAGILGGVCGAGLSVLSMKPRVDRLDARLTEYETMLRETQNIALEAQTRGTTVEYSDPGAGLSPAMIYDRAIHQVVGIRTEVTRTNFFGMSSSGAVSGSGFFISDDGYILTNYHVVEDAYLGKFDIEVMTYDGTQYQAMIVGTEPANDLAVLKIETDGLSPVTLGNSDLLHVGDVVYAVGNPLGELEFSMSTGYVSALDRMISTQENETINMFQIDAAVNEGNSGGPVYGSDGSVVGIVTAKYSSSGVEGLGFAIPVNDAKAIAEDLITKGYVTGKAYIGVSLDNRYNSMYSQYYGLPLGAYVSYVMPDSAAEKAGLQIGDIITAIGEYPVEGYDELKSVLRHFRAFESTEVTIYRGGSVLNLAVTFDEATPENS